MKKILIVDDEAEIVRLLGRFLDSRGYDVSTATDGKEVMGKMKVLRPDAVLLDLIMPGIGGIEILKEIKSFSPQTAVIIITAVLDEGITRLAHLSGADDYILKPFGLKEIEKKLSSAIDHCQK